MTLREEFLKRYFENLKWFEIGKIFETDIPSLRKYLIDGEEISRTKQEKFYKVLLRKKIFTKEELEKMEDLKDYIKVKNILGE